VDVTSGAPSLTFRDEGEAADFARQLREALKLGYTVRGNHPPRLLRAARDGLSAAFGATGGRTYPQADARRGPSGAAPARDVRLSYEPAMLTVKEASRLAEVHPRTVRKWIERRHVEARRGPGGAHQVDMGSLTAKIISRRRKGNDESRAA
jgi:hypothetical protein